MACWHFKGDLNKFDETYGVMAPPLASELLVRLPIISLVEVNG